jgi:hypothetical protein
MLFFMLYVFVWEECVAVCVALFADLYVRIVLRGPPPAPAAIHMANSRNCVSASATRPSGTPHFTNPNFQLRVEVFDTSWISVQCALNTFGPFLSGFVKYTPRTAPGYH